MQEVWRCLQVVSVADVVPLHAEAVAHLDVASAMALAERDVAAFGEPLEGDEADAAVFVGQVRPDDVVEDVCLYGVDGGRERGQSFRT